MADLFRARLAASMRPRHRAAEYEMTPMEAIPRKAGFNEAAA